jgi:hypothetical protein
MTVRAMTIRVLPRTVRVDWIGLGIMMVMMLDLGRSRFLFFKIEPGFYGSLNLVGVRTILAVFYGVGAFEVDELEGYVLFGIAMDVDLVVCRDLVALAADILAVDVYLDGCGSIVAISQTDTVLGIKRDMAFAISEFFLRNSIN